MIETLLVIITTIVSIQACGLYAFYKYFMIIKGRFEKVSELLDEKVKIVNNYDKRMKELESAITVLRLGKR